VNRRRYVPHVQQLDPKDRGSLDRFIADLRALYGSTLRAVALSGEAASATYRPRVTPLQTVVVLDEVSPKALREARPHLRAWRRARIPTPLFLDPRYIETSLDTFPLEFLELREHHLLLHGEVDPFAALTIDTRHLRLQVEEQLRGKLLHLWEAYLESGGARKPLERLLLESFEAFAVAMRGLLRVRGVDPAGAGGRALVGAVSHELGIPLPTLAALADARESGARLPASDLDARFESYLAELRALVRATDAAVVAGEPAGGSAG
jgi:hypothetical protein